VAILLRRVLKLRLIALFVVVASGILLLGFGLDVTVEKVED